MIGFLSLPPILASATTSSRATAIVSVYCIVLSGFSIFWNDVQAGDYAIRMTIIALAGVLSYWNSLLREELSAGARGAAVLAGGLTRLDTPVEEAATAERVVGAAVPELADVAIVDLLHADGAIRAAAIAASDPASTRLMQRIRAKLYIDPESRAPVAEAVRSGEQGVYTKMGDATWREMAVDNVHLKMLRELQPRSMLVLPLKAHGQTFGVLSLGSLHSHDRFGSGEIAFAEELAARAATGLANARLHQTQSHLARTLQENLLPRGLPRIEGLEIAAGFRPAGLGTEVGGDFYDLFQLGDSKWAAVIGDVCGKGPEAAALTSLMRDTLRSSALRGESPRETLSLLNAAILEAGVDRRFCTSAYVSFDLGARTSLVACNGGHPPPLILRKGGRVERLGPPGTLLGVFEDPTLTDTTEKLARGDLVLLYTDGLFDVSPTAAAKSMSVEDMLAVCKGMSAENTAAAIEQQALNSQGGDPQDDLAILVLKRV